MLSPDKLIYVCEAVLWAGKPCLVVVHNSNGDGQFLCGSEDHGEEPGQETARLVHLSHLIADDPTLAEILDLPPGFSAERDSKGAPWLRLRLPPDEDDFE